MLRVRNLASRLRELFDKPPSKLADQIEADPFLDVDGFERILDRLHVKAFPDAKTRPPRLYAHELEDVRED